MNASPHRQFTRTVAGFLVLLGLLGLPAGASPRGWSFFSSPWSQLSALWEDIGLVVDPSGEPRGIVIEADPGGRPALGVVIGNLGAVADPNGLPAANPGSQDIGLVVDPDGQASH
ncbi:MAG TPA: hypothetical protein VGS22_04130 [Thermoanaerobaculia bacterium]|jgi:hypothetical protein|nr:hypothetical protein [Thermoanaerobaculia bacterium]